MHHPALGFGFGFRLNSPPPKPPTPAPTFEGTLDFSSDVQSGLLALIMEDF